MEVKTPGREERKPARVMFARFPFGRSEDPDVTDWLVETVLKAKADERVAEVHSFVKDDTPITLSRNLCMEVAKKKGMDLVVMVDSDMKPDAYLASNPNRLGADPHARPFWDMAFNFWWTHNGPCVIGAPYCGPPPIENVYVFRWANYQSDHPNSDVRLEQYTREEAAQLFGFDEVAALPTGLILIDVKGLERISPPYFRYEWEDVTESKKGSTEDVVFTRDLSLAGVPQYCLWNAWAGHWKRKCVGRPALLPVDAVRQQFADAVRRNQPSNERMVVVNGDHKKEILDLMATRPE
jgi:hypothetical protein